MGEVQDETRPLLDNQFRASTNSVSQVGKHNNCEYNSKLNVLLSCHFNYVIG